MKIFAIILVAAACIAALRITVREYIDEHEQTMLDSENEK